MGVRVVCTNVLLFFQIPFCSSLQAFVPKDLKDFCECDVLLSAVLTFDVRLSCEIEADSIRNQYHRSLKDDDDDDDEYKAVEEPTDICHIFVAGGANVIQLFVTGFQYAVFYESSCDFEDGSSLEVSGDADTTPNIFQTQTNITACDATFQFPDLVSVDCNCTSACDELDPFTVELSCGVDPEPTTDVKCSSIFTLAAAVGKRKSNKNSRDSRDKHF